MSRETQKQIWAKGIKDEVQFWRMFLQLKGDQWQAEYQFRLDPSAPLQDYIIRYLDENSSSVSLLDAGAGPMTILGKTWQGHDVDITAVDALGIRYNDLLRKLKIVVPVPTQEVHSENLTSVFPKNHFDLSHARNALDHGYDPRTAIRQMLEVVKPGGYCLLDHAIREGESENYNGLHQWDFYPKDNDLHIAGRNDDFSLAESISDLGAIVEVTEGGPQFGGLPGDSGWVFVAIRKCEQPDISNPKHDWNRRV